MAKYTNRKHLILQDQDGYWGLAYLDRKDWSWQKFPRKKASQRHPRYRQILSANQKFNPRYYNIWDRLVYQEYLKK